MVWTLRPRRKPIATRRRHDGAHIMDNCVCRFREAVLQFVQQPQTARVKQMTTSSLSTTVHGPADAVHDVGSDDDFNFDYDIDATAMPSEEDLIAGGCYGLAIVLHEKTGLPLHGLFDASGACHHAFVHDETTGIAYDARGGVSLQDILSYKGRPCMGQIVGSLALDQCESLAAQHGFDDDEYDLLVDYAEEHDSLAQLLADAYGPRVTM